MNLNYFESKYSSLKVWKSVNGVWGVSILLKNKQLDILNLLNHKNLSYIGYATDMLCLIFGNTTKKKNCLGDYQVVGEFAIHVQCTWRFIQEHRIIFTYWDLFEASIKDDKTVCKNIFLKFNENFPLQVHNNLHFAVPQATQIVMKNSVGQISLFCVIVN